MPLLVQKIVRDCLLILPCLVGKASFLGFINQLDYCTNWDFQLASYRGNVRIFSVGFRWYGEILCSWFYEIIALG